LAPASWFQNSMTVFSPFGTKRGCRSQALVPFQTCDREHLVHWYPERARCLSRSGDTRKYVLRLVLKADFVGSQMRRRAVTSSLHWFFFLRFPCAVNEPRLLVVSSAGVMTRFLSGTRVHQGDRVWKTRVLAHETLLIPQRRTAFVVSHFPRNMQRCAQLNTGTVSIREKLETE